MSLNDCIFQGRLTKDPELRRTQQGKAVTTFTLAVDRDYNREETDYVTIVSWGKLAEFAEQYFHKGQEALVRGRLQMRDWTDKNGNKRTSAEINAAEIHFCGPKQTQQTKPGYARAGTPEYTEIEDEDDGELPF